MVNIGILPNELLIDIFRYVRKTNPESLKPFLTCRSSQDAAKVVLYEQISLAWKLNSRCSIIKFSQLSSANAHLVRCLRLEIPSTVFTCFLNGMRLAYNHVDAICSLIASMTGLHTFSINLEGQCIPSSLFPASIIARILNALSPSVVNLELDTEALEVSSIPSRYLTDEHLCPVISSLISRLHTLRLRLGCICADIFSSLRHDYSNAAKERSTSQLRHASIKLTLPVDRKLGRSAIIDCGSVATFAPGGAVARQTFIRSDTLFNALLELQTQKAFPLLKSFLIFSESDDRKGSGKVSDVVHRAITVYSFGSNTSSLQYRQFGLSHIVKDHEGATWFGEEEDMWSAVEEGLDLCWKDAECGVRVPPRSSVDVVGMHRLNVKRLRSTEENFRTTHSIAERLKDSRLLAIPSYYEERERIGERERIAELEDLKERARPVYVSFVDQR